MIVKQNIIYTSPLVYIIHLIYSKIFIIISANKIPFMTSPNLIQNNFFGKFWLRLITFAFFLVSVCLLEIRNQKQNEKQSLHLEPLRAKTKKLTQQQNFSRQNSFLQVPDNKKGENSQIETTKGFQQYNELKTDHSSKRLLSACSITDCLACELRNGIEFCLVCLYPKMLSLSMDSCGSSIVDSSTTNCTLEYCNKCTNYNDNGNIIEVCTECSVGFNILRNACQSVHDNTEMQTQWYPDGQYFYLCQEGCLTCRLTPVVELCIQCKRGYFYMGAHCLKCPDGCSICTSSSSCTSCLPGFGLSNSLCVRCLDQNCLSCDLSRPLPNPYVNFSQCIFPKDTYFMEYYSHKWTQCPQNCLSCINYRKCSKCKPSFYLHGQSSADVRCEPCPTGCYRCTSLDLCQACYPGYAKSLVITGEIYEAVCALCPENCQFCPDLDNCVICKPGYYYINAKCFKPIPNCLLLNSKGICTACKSLYELSPDNTSCIFDDRQNDSNPVKVACKAKLNALNFWCSSYNTQLHCSQNEYLQLSDYACHPCNIPNCLSCTSPVTCTSCTDGYYLESHFVEPFSLKDGHQHYANYDVLGAYESYSRCQPCDASCKKCVTSSDFCSQCESGLVLNSQGKCEGPHKLKYFIISSKFQWNLIWVRQKIIEKLSSLSGYSSKPQIVKITFVSTWTGQTIMIGYLHFNDTTQLSQAQQKLNAVLQTGVNFLDYNLSQVIIGDKVKNYTQYTSNTQLESNTTAQSQTNTTQQESTSGPTTTTTSNQSQTNKLIYIIVAAISAEAILIVLTFLGVYLCRKCLNPRSNEVQNSSNEAMNQSNLKNNISKSSILDLNQSNSLDITYESTKRQVHHNPEHNGYKNVRKTQFSIENLS